MTAMVNPEPFLPMWLADLVVPAMILLALTLLAWGIAKALAEPRADVADRTRVTTLPTRPTDTTRRPAA